MQSLKVVFSHVIFAALTVGALLLYMKACTHKTLPPTKTQAEAESRTNVKDTVKKYTALLDTLKKHLPIVIPDSTVAYEEPYKPPTEKYVERIDTNGYAYIIDSLTQEIINISRLKDYINASPNNVVAAKFSKQQSTFDLLNVDGRIRTLKYKVDYVNYNYYFDGISLRAEKIYTGFIPKAKLQYPKAFYTTSNIYTSYDPFNQTINTQLDYSVYYGRLGLFNRVGIEYIPQSPAKAKYELGLTFRIK